MISIFCPWRRRQKRPPPCESPVSEPERLQTQPPVLEPIKYTPLDPISEEQQMLDAIFSSSNIGASGENGQGSLIATNPPSDSGSGLSRLHSRSGKARLGSLLRTTFSREGRPPAQDPTPEEKQEVRSYFEDPAPAPEKRPLHDILDSGNSSEAAYDSDAHRLLTPQLTARLKSSPGSKSMLAAFSPTPARDTPEPSKEPCRFGFDGTPTDKESEVDEAQADHVVDSNEGTLINDSSASEIDGSVSVSNHDPATSPTPMASLNVENGVHRTPTLTPSRFGPAGPSDDDISLLTLAGSTDSIEIHVTNPTGTLTDQTLPCDHLQVTRDIGTSVYSSPVSDNEYNTPESAHAFLRPSHCVKRSLTSSCVTPENVKKSRRPANEAQDSPLAAQRANRAFVRKSRFVEDLDDVFTLKSTVQVSPKDGDSAEKENIGRRSSDGWLSGGKRVGYGYTFPHTERYPRLSCSEGSAEEKYKAANALHPIKNGVQVDYRLPIQDPRNKGLIATDKPPESTFIHPNALGNNPSRKSSGAFSSLAKAARRQHGNRNSSTAVSGHSGHSQELEPFPLLDLDTDMPLGFDPARRDVNSGTYIRNPATAHALQSRRGHVYPAKSGTDVHPTIYDEGFSGCDEVEAEAEDVSPEPRSAEAWKELYNDCIQTR